MPAQASALLLTKLNRPPVTGDWVDRPRLIEQLNHSLQQGPLTLVCASAGFGKTTLVSSWIESLTAGSGRAGPRPHQRRGCRWTKATATWWFSCVTSLPRSVRSSPNRAPRPSRCSRRQTRQPQAPLVVALGNELERLPARVVLVLDDYYAIRGDAVHDFLSELLRHWPQRLHLVLISRSNPPLPLANLRAKGQVVEIRTRDLRFTPEEAAAFLDKVLAAPLSRIRDGLARSAPGGLDRRSAPGDPVAGRRSQTRKVSWRTCRAPISRLPTIWWTKSWPARRLQS